MAMRAVIEIDEEKCDGCGLCAGGCHEGALRIIDGKARLVGESLCDGLGACIGECPRGALRTVEREVEEYDERRVIENILPKGANTIAAHLEHLRSHGQDTWYAQALDILKEKGLPVPAAESAACGCGGASLRPVPSTTRASAFGASKSSSPQIDNLMSGGCPGSAARSFAAGTPARTAAPVAAAGTGIASAGSSASRLEQWPVQLHLVNPRAPVFPGCRPADRGGLHGLRVRRLPPGPAGRTPAGDRLPQAGPRARSLPGQDPGPDRRLGSRLRDGRDHGGSLLRGPVAAGPGSGGLRFPLRPGLHGRRGHRGRKPDLDVAGNRQGSIRRIHVQGQGEAADCLFSLRPGTPMLRICAVW